jgi:hypothetical protein
MPQSLARRLVQSATRYIDAHHASLGVALFLIPALAAGLVLTEACCALVALFG